MISFLENAFCLQLWAHMWAPILNFTIPGCVALFLLLIQNLPGALLRKKLRQQVHIHTHAANKMKSISLLKSGSPPAGWSGSAPRGVAVVCALARYYEMSLLEHLIHIIWRPLGHLMAHVHSYYGITSPSACAALYYYIGLCKLYEPFYFICGVERRGPFARPSRLRLRCCWKFCQSRRCDFKWAEGARTLYVRISHC